jgi:hypothetical protein
VNYKQREAKTRRILTMGDAAVKNERKLRITILQSKIFLGWQIYENYVGGVQD